MRGEDRDTQFRIVDAATRLFAEKGFGQTSVREIAAHAEVNIAAINYHFGSKEGLYQKICSTAEQILAKDMESIAASTTACEDFLMKCYDYLLSEHEFLRNLFKMMLSDELVVLSQPGEQFPGPPGSQLLYRRVESELPEKTPSRVIAWVTHSLFTLLMHEALMNRTRFVLELRKKNPTPELSEEFAKDSLRLATRALLAYAAGDARKYRWPEMKRLASK